MEAKLEPGKYVLAVSGGVDSMVLLRLLATTYCLPNTKYHFVVAHFDHGIRSDSAKDKKLVEKIAKKLGLEFVYGQGKLGEDASEAKARDARYQFLRSVLRENGARAIVTAHHQDDAVETLIINMLRGTGRRGVLKETNEIKRPLLGVSKDEILEYAKAHKIEWREDLTNTDTKYLRNYVRLVLLPKMKKVDPQVVDKLLDSSLTLKEMNQEIEQELFAAIEGNCKIEAKKIIIPSHWLIMLPNEVGKEVLYECVRKLSMEAEIDRKNIENLLVFAKTAKPNKQMPFNKKIKVLTEPAKIILELV